MDVAGPTAGLRRAGLRAPRVVRRSRSQVDRRVDRLGAIPGPAPDAPPCPLSARVRGVPGSRGRRPARSDRARDRRVLAPPMPVDPRSDQRVGPGPMAGADDRAALDREMRVAPCRDAYRSRERAEIWVRVRVLQMAAGPASRGLPGTKGRVPSDRLGPAAGRGAVRAPRPGEDRDAVPVRGGGRPRNRGLGATCRRARLVLAIRRQDPSGATPSPHAAPGDLVSAWGSCSAFHSMPALAVTGVLDRNPALE